MDTLEDLVSYQRQLDQEEEFLTKLILQINEQINRLQVEQMELQSSMFESSSPQQKETKPKIQKPLESSNEELILTVPMDIKCALEEEIEEEDEEDDEEN